MFPDFALSDISNLFMPFPVDDVDPEASQSMDTGKLIIRFVIRSTHPVVAWDILPHWNSFGLNVLLEGTITMSALG